MPELNPETERELILKVNELLRTNPPDPALYEAMAIGMYFDEVPLGAEQRPCRHCGDLAWVGPNTLMLIELEGGPRHVMCMVCGLAAAAIRQSEGAHVDVHRSEDVLRGDE